MKKQLLIKTSLLLVGLVGGANVGWADDVTTLAEWSFNYDYDISDGVGTPNATAVTSNGSTNLEGVLLKPNTQEVVGADFSIKAIRHEQTLTNNMQDSKGAYLEYASIDADGAALHMTSPLPNPASNASQYSWNSTNYDYDPSGTYSYQNPYNYFELKLNTANYASLLLEVKAAGHNCPTDGQKFVLMYSTDKSSWTQHETVANLASGYKKWTTTTFDLPAALADQTTCYIRIVPASTWYNNSTSQWNNNQLNLDWVKLTGTLSANKAQITGVTITDQTVTTGTSTDWNCVLPISYSNATTTFAVSKEYGTVTVTAKDANDNNVAVTDNGNNTFTLNTPTGNKATIATLTITPDEGAVAPKSVYTFRLFNLTDITITGLKVNEYSEDVPSAINTGDTYAATISAKTYTQVPTVQATLIDGSTVDGVPSGTGTSCTYSIAATIGGDSRTFNLTIDNIYIYTMTGSDTTFDIKWGEGYVTNDNKLWTSTTNSDYTLTTNQGLADGQSGTFKAQSTTHTITIPGDIKVKQFIIKNFANSYEGNSSTDYLKTVSSTGATAHIPTKNMSFHGDEAPAYDLVVTIDNHTTGTPIAFTFNDIRGQWRGYFQLVVEKVTQQLNENSSYTPVAITGANVTLTRTIPANSWSTLCLPFALTSEQITSAFGKNVIVAELTDNSTEEVLKFSTVTAMNANQPYAIKVKDGEYSGSATISGVTIVEGTSTQTVNGSWNFVGTYTSGNIPLDSYFFNSNKLYKAANESNTIKPFRAYFTPKGVGARELKFIIDGDDTTSIGTIKADGTMETTAEGTVYNLSGQRVNKPAKGLYVINGKKVIIK